MFEHTRGIQKESHPETVVGGILILDNSYEKAQFDKAF